MLIVAHRKVTKALERVTERVRWVCPLQQTNARAVSGTSLQRCARQATNLCRLPADASDEELARGVAVAIAHRAVVVAAMAAGINCPPVVAPLQLAVIAAHTKYSVAPQKCTHERGVPQQQCQKTSWLNE